MWKAYSHNMRRNSSQSTIKRGSKSSSGGSGGSQKVGMRGNSSPRSPTGWITPPKLQKHSSKNTGYTSSSCDEDDRKNIDRLQVPRNDDEKNMSKAT
mmetsp:Transcript_22648/g.36398  ORF Transcript_22648/g.36398 Transcript_22648/m.36398 type:complete len:97 (-) Transcript_22648:269-559(-)